MGSKKDYEKELWLNTLKWGSPTALGVLGLITSTFLDLTGVLPSTPSYIFRIINGISIALIVIFGFIWLSLNKKVQEKYEKSTKES